MNANLSDVAVIGFLLAALSLPLALGLVPRNRFYGFRVPATLRDDRVWQVTNRRMGWEMIALGLALWVFSDWLATTAIEPSQARVIGVVTMIVALIAFTIRGWRFANRVARERAPSPPLSRR
jgi:hypothetical protein